MKDFEDMTLEELMNYKVVIECFGSISDLVEISEEIKNRKEQ